MREALSQPEQEPCEYCKRGLKTMCLCGMKAQPEQELTTTLEASVHAGLDKKNDKNPQVDHQGKQPEQEPIGTVKELFTLDAWERLDLRGSTQVYTTPPQRKPLTDEQICPWFQENTALTNEAAMRITRAIEAAHGIKGDA